MIGPARRWICIDNHASDAELHISWHIIYASHDCLSLLVSDDSINKGHCEDLKAEGSSYTGRNLLDVVCVNLVCSIIRFGCISPDFRQAFVRTELTNI
uniref:Uncharacterized protein n=1 Tax=Solanum lycopersicum TaxID=4081 RepID=A0A3Q7I2N3_SOLLC